jgi:hypothetical protein
MKTILLGILSITFFFSPIFSQNIIGTLGTNGTFTIKDGSTNYFTLTQSNGFINILRNMRLEHTTSSNVGVITKSGTPFLHDYGATTNIFLGGNSGNFTLTGANNAGVGYNSLMGLTTGYDNCAFGTSSLVYNTVGYDNCAFGSGSLQSNLVGNWNSSFGYNSLRLSIGNQNSAFGSYSLTSNVNGGINSGFGVSSLENNVSGSSNTAIGVASLYNNSSGFYNSALGTNCLNNITTGSNNTGIGYNAVVPSATASNQVRIGNTSVTYAGVQVGWTITSDRKWKQNILSTNLGLNFISKLNPVYYTRINDENQKFEYGFIGQEVDSLLKEFGINSSGMITVTDEGKYELRYNDLFAPIVRAIQELKAKNENLESENQQLENKLIELNLLNDRLTKIELILQDKTNIKEVSEQK